MSKSVILRLTYKDTSTRRNPMARELCCNSLYKGKVIRSKKIYSRKNVISNNKDI